MTIILFDLRCYHHKPIQVLKTSQKEWKVVKEDNSDQRHYLKVECSDIVSLEIDTKCCQVFNKDE